MTITAYDALRSYIESTSDVSEALAGARSHAEEYGLSVPDEATGQLLTSSPPPVLVLSARRQ